MAKENVLKKLKNEPQTLDEILAKEQQSIQTYVDSFEPDFKYKDLPTDVKDSFSSLFLLVFFACCGFFLLIDFWKVLIILFVAFLVCFRYCRTIYNKFKNKEYYKGIFTVTDKTTNYLAQAIKILTKDTYTLTYLDKENKVNTIKFSTNKSNLFTVGQKYEIYFSNEGQVLSKKELS